MSAGLPGLGLSGLFILLSAFGMPVLRRNGRRKGRLLVLGVVIAAAAVASWDLMSVVVRTLTEHTTVIVTGGPGGPQRHTVTTFAFGNSVPVLAISLGILGALLVGAELAAHLLRGHKTPLPPPVELESPGVGH